MTQGPDRPWTASYGAGVAAQLPPPRHPSLAHLIAATCRDHADRTAFTCVVSNGMNGSQIGRAHV